MKKDVEFSDDEPCGCGSDQIYAKCCKHERAKYVRRGHGTVFRQVALTKEALDAINETKRHFKKVFGRNPGKGDKVFATSAFRQSPADFVNEFEKIANEAGIESELIYAYRRTRGLMLTSETFDLASPSDREEWMDAIRDYRAGLENGIDLLLDQGSVAEALADFFEFLESVVTHVGSYADRAPRRTKSSLPIFLQFMLISRCHQCLKIIADHWDGGASDEAFSLLRTIYECTLLIARLEMDPSYADTIMAQTLAGTDIFPYRKKNNGETDYSKIIDINTNITYEARSSFLKCAKHIGIDALHFYDILYPILSSRVHFDTLEMLNKYRKVGSFVMWQEKKREESAIAITIVVDYLASTVAQLRGATRILRRDAKFLHARALETLGALIWAVEDEDRNLEPAIMALVIAALHNFVLPPAFHRDSAP